MFNIPGISAQAASTIPLDDLQRNLTLAKPDANESLRHQVHAAFIDTYILMTEAIHFKTLHL